MLPETLAHLLPTITFFASTGGAGWAASALFAAARRAFPAPTLPAWRAAGPARRLVWRALHAPRGARLTVFALAALIAIVCATLLAALTSQPVMPALDAALAIVVSQLIHAAGLPGEATPREVPA